MTTTDDPRRTPVYFLSIGGPNFIGDKNHPAYGRLASVGKEITTQVKPDAIVVFSAHWQAGPSKVLINVAENAEIIYDFYGFPAHYYQVKYPNKGSCKVAEQVIDKLTSAGIEVGRVERGLDHGIWAGFLAAFDPKTNPLNVPIVQVSLYDSEDFDQHYRLGQALESLRDENIVIIGAGMAVHNLLDFRKARAEGRAEGWVMPYASTFDDAVKEAVGVDPKQRQAAMAALMKREDARSAHPTVEHIMPVHIVAGAAGPNVGEQLWTMPEGSLSWAQYRFGSVDSQARI